MYAYKKRFYDFEFEASDGTNVHIDVICPSLKVIEEFRDLGENAPVDEINLLVSKMLSKNKQKITVSKEIVDEFEFEKLFDFMNGFFNWIDTTKANDPN